MKKRKKRKQGIERERKGKNTRVVKKKKERNVISDPKHGET